MLDKLRRITALTAELQLACMSPDATGDDLQRAARRLKLALVDAGSSWQFARQFVSHACTSAMGLEPCPACGFPRRPGDPCLECVPEDPAT